MDTISPSSLIDFLVIIGKLKHLDRSGWVLNDIPKPESVASHMYRMGIISLVVPANYDKNKCIKMALVHDIAEAIVGDITPHDNISHDTKVKMEKDAIVKMMSIMGNGNSNHQIAKEIINLWNEYEEGISLEAKFIRDIDKFDMILTAYEYEIDYKKDLQEFFDSTKDVFLTPEISKLAKNLLNKRSYHANN